MKKILLTLFIFSSLFSSAQSPLVKTWDRDLGGTDWDHLSCLRSTADGGYILAGYSASNAGGDKSQNIWGMRDYWIVKVDSFGHKQWDKDFGGTDYDQPYSICQAADGGYAIAGKSMSAAGGTKTQGTCATGNNDYWVIKTDSLGNIQWDKDFGGWGTDEAYSVIQTNDLGFLIGGYSYSNINCDKTQVLQGVQDYWLVKTDSNGVKQWDWDYGGTNSDFLYSVQQTLDGGYILGGYSWSGIGGDKTQNTFGNYDYWILKIDSLGIKQWDADFGGSNDDFLFCVQQTFDGGYILGGTSYSGITGNKTQPNWDATGITSDYWIVKTDSLGNMQWDKDFGGNNIEEFFSIEQTQDSGFIIGGDSYSPVSGDKTENNVGQEQTWFIKTDSLGNKQWEKTLLSAGDDEQGSVIQSRNGCYVVANGSTAGAGFYKSQPNKGAWDYWIIQFCDSNMLPSSAATATQNLCPGACIDFTNLSANAISYQWSFPGATIDTSTAADPSVICYATPGIYDVQLISNNYIWYDTLTLSNYITVFPHPAAQAISQSDDTLFSNQGAATYQWYLGGNLISGATDYFYLAMQQGDYYLIATDTNGCEVEAAIFNVQVSTKSFSVFSDRQFIYPNPASSVFLINTSSLTSSSQIKIFNALGIIQLCRTVSKSENNVDVSNLTTGIYFLELTSNGKTFRSRFVKQ